MLFAHFFRPVAVFIQGKEKGEQDTDGEENPEYPVPGRGGSGEMAENDDQHIGKPHGIGEGGHHLQKGAGGNGGKVLAGTNVEDNIGQGRQDKGKFLTKSFHMKDKTIAACIFPETVPDDDILFPLVHVFHPVVHCQAVEDDEIPAELASPVRDRMAESGLVRIHVPAPLGENRERFLSLIHDLATKKDDYAFQLKNLALSGIGGDPLKGESKNSIIDTLLQGRQITDQAREEREMLLWQARLVLKLGEIFDAEQRALEREMEKIAQKEQGLFSELRREQSEPFSLTKKLASGETRGDGLPKLRLKAWSRLFCLGTEKLDHCFCFVTTNQDALDLLIEKYEQDGEHQARQLPVILLPARHAEESWQEQLHDFQERAGDLRAELAHILGNIDTWSGPDDTFISKDGTWAQLLDTVYPGSRHGRCRLHLYRIGNEGSCELFMETFGREKGQVRGREKSGQGFLIGRLEPAAD